MSDLETKTPTEWCEIFNITVLDPDGWDRGENFQEDWAKPLTILEFVPKFSQSTVSMRGGYDDLSLAYEEALKNA